MPAPMSGEPDSAEYTCPMHPEVRKIGPGSCPKCGMALEPATLTLSSLDEVNPEYVDMRRRFWLSVFPTAILLVLMFLNWHQPWLELALATPVVLWAGWPLFQRGWESLVNRSLNMFTLIAAGTGTAFLYSLAGTITPGIFPESFRGHGAEVAVYFEPAAAIVTFGLLAPALELRPRSPTSSAIQSLLGFTPKTARRHPPSPVEA